MYTLKAYKSARDSVKKTKGQEKYAMPGPGTMIVSGTTGSGKSNILCNLLDQKQMLKNYFDIIYLFRLSPCEVLEDNCNIKPENVFTDDDPEKLVKIMQIQQEFIKKNGFKDAPHILIILDDIAHSDTFLKHRILKDIFFGSTHSKLSLWICSQNYMEIPRKLRMNTHSMILCHGAKQTEIERFMDEYQSPDLDKKEFKGMVDYALSKPYGFMFVNNKNPNKKEAYRSTFDEVLKIE